MILNNKDKDLHMQCENDLLGNLDKLHTTELGIERLKRNLSLETDNVVEWCKDTINSENAVITRNGKNWYVSAEECIITVNANSYTIITAHKEIADTKVDVRDIERSIQKKFHKSIWSRFTKAVNNYELVKEGDKIAVCISGGKDSMLMAKLFQELKRHDRVDFDVVFLVMDPGYSSANRKLLESNAKHLNVPVTIFESDIFDSVFNIEKSPCYLCARMRRGHLYNKARELGCNKISLGHHFDDVIETILMGMLYGGQIQTMMPKLHSTNFDGMELIRPLYLIREDDIKAWSAYNRLHFLRCACRFTESCAASDNESASKRLEIKALISELKKTNPFVESNIFKSVENVNLSTVIAYKQDGERHHFLDDYDK